MGASHGSFEKREYSDALSSFTPQEREQIKHCFTGFAGSADAKTFKWNSFHVKCNNVIFEYGTKSFLSESLQQKTFMEFCYQSFPQKGYCQNLSGEVTQHGFLLAIYLILAAPFDQRAMMIERMCGGQNKFVSKEKLNEFLVDLINTYFAIELATPECSTWRFSVTNPSAQNLAEFLVHDLKETDENGYTTESIEKWLGQNSVFLALLDAVFRTAFDLKLYNEELKLKTFSSPTIPCALDCDWNKFHTILTLPSLLTLNHNIPVEFRRQWRLLFSSVAHGESFSRLISSIEEKGPCLIIVKDKDGYIFGGFCSTGLTLGPTFSGDERCFLFTLHPKLFIYWATGYNRNYVYFNYHQQTMLNGFGMGAMEMSSSQQQDARHFGLWLDSDFGFGRSRKNCTTFSSEQLSANETFQIDSVEVWAVGPKPKPISDQEQQPSILDVDPAVKAILAMTGKGPISEGLRQTNDTNTNS